MDDFKGTPGPWTGKDVGIYKQDDAGLQLGFIMTFDDNRRAECAANAHLIAAAPELLEALQQSLPHLREQAKQDGHAFGTLQLVNRIIAIALGETK